MLPPENEPTTPYFPTCCFYHSAVGTVNDMLLKLLHFFFDDTINQHVWQCMYEIDFTLNKFY